MAKKGTHEEVLNNRAKLQQAAEKTECCAKCDNPVVFLLRDNYHEFTLGLDTVLQCLHFVEEQGAVPPIPWGWWYQIQSDTGLPVPKTAEQAMRNREYSKLNSM
jgi:hypothetical protein